MKAIQVGLIVLAVLLLFAPVVSVRAVCGPGNASDSWTPRTGATFSITATACPGTNPHHTLSSSRTDLQLIPQNSTYYFVDDDRVSPNTGNRVYQTFTTGVGTMPSADQTYGPFSGNTIPNCGYTDFYITVLDNSTGQTHNLIAEAFGQTTGSCPV